MKSQMDAVIIFYNRNALLLDWHIHLSNNKLQQEFPIQDKWLESQLKVEIVVQNILLETQLFASNDSFAVVCVSEKLRL